MMRKRSIVHRALVAGLLGLVARTAQAQMLSPLEFKCQLKTAASDAKFVSGKFKCVTHCWYDYWHSGSMSSYADCLPPYGGATALCIDDTILGVKGVENKYAATVLKACTPAPTRDCPECYSGGDCAAAASDLVSTREGEVDSFVPAVFCERATAMPQEQWCQEGVARVIAKLVAAEQKCYAKCEQNAFKGLIPSSSCLPPTSDATTGACISAAEAKTTFYIDQHCNDAEVPHSEPECDDSSSYPDGAAWTNLTSVWVAGTISPLYCGSPSGAFVD